MFREFVVGAVGAATVALATAAPASANAVDDAFIATIDGYPVPYSTPADAVTLARTVCDYLAAGKTFDAVVVDIGGPANWTIPQTEFFVRSAIPSYCPGQPAASPVAQAPAPVAPVPVYPQATLPSSSYFPNCSAARSAGAAPLYSGQAGYRSGLDRDGDGVACE